MALSKTKTDLPKPTPTDKPPAYILIENYKDLIRIAGQLQREKALGVDLEADSMFHYQEKVCLIQISTASKSFVCDPLVVKDVSPLAALFADSDIRKVLHGADYDIRSLQRDFGIEVGGLFDTQIAARFLGMKETGLASLLKSQMGITIEKKYQKKDWSKRPLPAAMLSYAVQDACYLISMAKRLENELRLKGRLSWVEEECELQSKVTPPRPDKRPFFMRFKGSRKLDRRSLAVLESVLRLRDEVARRRNLPPFKVLGSSPIMEIAQRKPETEADLKTIKGISPKRAESLAGPLLKRIHQALSQPEDSLPFFPKRTPRRIAPKATKRGKALKGWREKRADDLEVDAAIICTNSQIRSIAEENPRNVEHFGRIDGIRNWQKEFFGQEICDLLKRVQ
jgi:ribonuclease D